MDAYPLLAIYSPFPSRFKVEDARSDIRILALADFPFAIEIPYGLRQGLQHVRPFSSQDVIDVVHGSDVGLSAFESSRDTEQAHQVRVVCMKELTVMALVEESTAEDHQTGSGHTVHSSDRS